MDAGKLDGKAVGAGLLFLFNVLLWFVQVIVDYVIAGGGSWEMGGIIQNVMAVIVEPTNWMFLLVTLIAAITLLTRKRAAAIIGLLVLAGYFVYLLIPRISGEVMDWLDTACRIAGIVFAAIALAASGEDSTGHKVVGGLAIILIAAWWVLSTVLGIMDGTYASMDIIVAAIQILRRVLFALAVVLAAKALLEKKPAGAHFA